MKDGDLDIRNFPANRRLGEG